MKGRWSLYRDIRHRLGEAGLSPDQAAEAARLADLAVRERRNYCIRKASVTMSRRKLARLWGLSISTVQAICEERSVIDSKPNTRPGDPDPAG